MVMLADTDAGSVVTAAQSGARTRYAMVLPEILLVPILYVVQEAALRLGIVTRDGLGDLVRRAFGRPAALAIAGVLLVTAGGALVSEFAGIAGVGSLVGLPRGVSVGVVGVALLAVVTLGRYRWVEATGLAIGALEVFFVVAAIRVHQHVGIPVAPPAGSSVGTSTYLTLLVANVGAVVMPWMVFYQQQAVIDKGYRGLSTARALRAARLDTAIGAVVTQVIMIGVVVATAATVGATDPGRPLGSIDAIAGALAPALGRGEANLLFGLGMLGASVVAALVVTLAGAWAIAEVLGWRYSLNDAPRRAGGFHAVAGAGLVIAALVVVGVGNLVGLSVTVEILNALVLPVVLLAVVRLEGLLPDPWRSTGLRRTALRSAAVLVTVLALVGAGVLLAGL